jgi:hypothetical protein
MNVECTSAGKRFHRATNVFANIRRAPPPRTLRLTVPSRRSRANECAPAPDYATGRRTASVPSTAFRNACNIAQAAARLPHFHRTCLWSRLKTSIELYARITSEVSIHPCPEAKGAPTKGSAQRKRAEVRTKKNCSMPATSKPTGNEKAARQLRRPFLQGRIVPTEANSVKTLWRNLMSVKRGVSINFWEINMFVFSSLQKRSTWLGIVQFPGKTPSGDV